MGVHRQQGARNKPEPCPGPPYPGRQQTLSGSESRRLCLGDARPPDLFNEAGITGNLYKKMNFNLAHILNKSNQNRPPTQL